MTLICRRSARVFSASSSSSRSPGDGVGSAAAGRRRWPHCPQKFELGGFLLPHDAQRLAKVAPHCAQRPTLPEFVKPQAGHSTSRTSHPRARFSAITSRGTSARTVSIIRLTFLILTLPVMSLSDIMVRYGIEKEGGLDNAQRIGKTALIGTPYRRARAPVSVVAPEKRTCIFPASAGESLAMSEPARTAPCFRSRVVAGWDDRACKDNRDERKV